MPVDINTCATPYISKCKKTTVEVINDAYGGATSPVFPSAIKGSIHIVQYTDKVIFYVKGTDGVWVETIELPVGELRVSLNGSTPTFTPADVNNPTIAEVDAWVTTNLSTLELNNGTQVVYFVPGDGGNADNPDFIWTLNDGQATLSSKREYNGRVHYLTTKGNNTQALVGYPHYPYKDFDFVLNSNPNFLNGDVLHVRPGEYTSTVQIPIINKEINLYLEEGVKINSNGNHFFGITTPIYSATDASKISVQGYGEILHQPPSLTRMFRTPYDTEINVKLKKLTLLSNNNQAWGFSALSKKSYIEVDEVICDKDKLVYGSGTFSDVPITEVGWDRTFKCKSIVATNQIMRASLIRIQPNSTPPFSRDVIEIGNIFLDETNIVGAGGVFLQSSTDTNFDDHFVSVTIDNIINKRTGVTPFTNYDNSGSNSKTPEISIGGGSSGLGAWRRLNFNALMNNVDSNGPLVEFRSIYLDNSKFKVTINNGVSNNCAPLTFMGCHLSNKTVAIFDLNIETKANNPCAILYYPNIDSTSKAILKGSYKTSAAATATIQIAAGSATSRLYLEDCTLINDGTVANITTNSGTPITIVCKNVFMNSVINDPNITLVGTYFQNAIYN